MSFQAIDKENIGQVTRAEWADVMLRVTGIKILWLAIMKSLVPADALTPHCVDYIDFLAAFTQEVSFNFYRDIKFFQISYFCILHFTF
jgi:hypothetical protein